MLKQIIKPAMVTSIGFLIVAASNILTELTPPYFSKLGWTLVALGTIWFFIKK